MNNNENDFYRNPESMTQLAAFADQIDYLPDNPQALASIVRGLLQHDSEVDQASDRLKDRDLMNAEAIMQRILQLDSSSLDIARPADERMVGYCYHFALLHCAFLRSKSIPSRARCGFVNYFDKGKWVDHWVTEYLDGGKWRLIDAHTGRDVVTHDEFHDAGTAWLECRSGKANPTKYGIDQLWGWDELRGSLINDLGSLNKSEYGHWDWCGLIDFKDKTQPKASVDERLDSIAEVTKGEAEFDKVLQIFVDQTELHPPTK